MQMKRWAMRMLAGVALVGLGGLAGCPPVDNGSARGVGSARTPLLERAVALLVMDSKSPEPGIRANSIEALQLLRDSRALNVIEQGLHDPEWVVRFSAAMAAGRRKASELKSSIQQMYGPEENGSVRVAMIYALKQMGDEKNMSQLAQSFKSPDVVTRANTAMVLGVMGDASAVPLLKSHLGDADVRVKFETTAALARLGDANSQEAILAMSMSQYAEDYYTALATCPDIKRPEVNNILARYFKLKDRDQDDPRFRWKTPEEKLIVERAALIAARAMGKLGILKVGGEKMGNMVTSEINVGDTCLVYLNNPNAELRALAALALGEILLPESEGRLETVLQDSDPRVQLAAAAAIVNITNRAESVPGRP